MKITAHNLYIVQANGGMIATLTPDISDTIQYTIHYQVKDDERGSLQYACNRVGTTTNGKAVKISLTKDSLAPAHMSLDHFLDIWEGIVRSGDQVAVHAWEFSPFDEGYVYFEY